jgi:hypothetical protein
MPLYDPVATREHIKQFLRVDITKHYLFNPIDGQGGGPTYLVNQEKIIACIYYYVLHTGDVRFLDEQIDGKSVLEWVFFHALFGDDLSQPAILVDYGEDVSHLELRHRYKYNHVLPDVNAGRYISYLRATTLATIAGRKRPDIDARSGPLKKLLKSTLWDSEHQWLGFQSATGLVELRYTNILYTLIGTGVLDPDDEFGMAGHLNDKEFLSDYGIHSISKLDPAYDQADIDHGGGGSYVAFPAVIAEALYKAGLYGFADDILERTLWWGLRMPYWGDSIVANRIEYRKDTHLQCDFGAAAGAQSIIFGMCGIKVNPNGSIIVNPHPPKFSQEIRLKNLQIRGRSLDIESNQRRYEVRFDGHSRSSAIGVPMLIQLRAEAG